MKLRLFVLLFSVVMAGCQKTTKIYTPREPSASEDLNQSPKGTALTIQKYEATDKKEKESFGIKFGDTTVQISGKGDAKSPADRFSTAQFVNTQKSCLLVQTADSTGLVAPFYLLNLNDGKLEVISLNRPSTGNDDARFTKGLTKVGLSGYLINNDYYVAAVFAKLYAVKRQVPEERIQGLYFLNSPDKKTLVFLISSTLYEVYYPTGETFSQLLSSKAPGDSPEHLYQWIQENYSWQKNAKNISFLKANVEDNRVRNFSEFK